MKRDLSCIIGAIVGLITGIGRGIGGFTLLSGPLMERMIGIGLIIVALWLTVSAVALIVKQTPVRKKWMTAGIILFWLDGILNGFMLFGSPQISGQIVNLIIVVVVLGFLWWRRIKA